MEETSPPPSSNTLFGVYIPLLILFILTLHYFVKKNGQLRRGRYPPGPSLSLPLIGNLLQLGRMPHRTFQKWRKEYGAVFSVKMASQSAVVVSDVKLVKELLAIGASAGRPRNPVFDIFGEGKYGIANRDGPHLEEQRRFSIRTLKDLGISKLEGIIMDEGRAMVAFLEKRVDRPITGNRLFNGAVLNSLWAIVSGERNDWDVPQEPDYLRKSGAFLEAVNASFESGLAFVPWLRHIIPDKSGWNNYLRVNKDFEEIAEEVVRKHMKEGSESDNGDFIDLYLSHVDTITDPTSSFYKETGMKNLESIVTDFFLAGSETTSTTLEFAMLYLSHYPEAQKEMQEEVDKVLGRERLPSLSDRPKLPYAEATIMEILRRSSILGMAVPHRAMADIDFHNYSIPKDDMLIPDIYGIHHDSQYWAPDPYRFDPTRFLNPDKTKVVKREGFIPFGSGKRICIGENLAKDTLFLFITSIMQRFSVEVETRMDVDDVIPGILMKPKPFKLIFRIRQ